MLEFTSYIGAHVVTGSPGPVVALGLLVDMRTKLADGDDCFTVSSAVSKPESCRSRLSRALFHLPGEAEGVIGDGNGVMSTKGPNPGEDKAEAGEREPTV